MSSTVQNQILDALYAAIKPIARFLLRAGISYREFNDICKSAFVEVATNDYGIRGRPTNISRVAVMTGLTRKEVKRLREQADAKFDSYLSKRSPPAEVLHYWYTDSKYLDDQNRPKILPYQGGDPSFANLVRQCAGDIPPGAMRTELSRVGAVAEHSDGSLEALRRDHFPVDSESRLLQMIRFGLRPLASTIAFNSDASNQSGQTRFQRTVHSSQIRASKVQEFEERVTAKLASFSEELDDDMSSVESDADSAADRLAANVGIGLYYFIDEE